MASFWHWDVWSEMFLLSLAVGLVLVVLLLRVVARRRAELQSIFDQMQEVLYRTDARGRVLMVTPSVEALTGYSPNEVRGRPVTDFYADEAERAELRRQLDAKGKVLDYRIRLRRKNGTPILVSVNSHVYRDGAGREAGVEGTFRDVTALARAEEKLQTLALAVENSPAGIVITDPQASILYVNPAFEQISGYSSKEALGRNPRFQSSGQTPAETYLEMWKTVTAGQKWRGEFLNRRKNGEFYCQSAAIAPVHDSHGTIRYFVAVQEDISERKRIAESLEKARWQADAANAAKSRFLAAASHDLRQPMQAMRLYLDVLAERIQQPQEQDIINKLQRTHADVGGMLDRLLDISQLDAGKVRVHPEMFDLSAVLRDLHELYESETATRGLSWRLHVPRDAVRIDSDPVLVKEVLSNLISNAIRYTQQGGILLSLRRRGDAVRIEVWDTGPGIDEQMHRDIFDEFIQLGNPERDRRKGVGLGLSIAGRLGRLLGGEVILKSRPGRGSLFFLSLPVQWHAQRANAPKKQGSQGAGAWDFQGSCVFVIDDDPLMRDSLGMMLQLWRCEVMTFADADSALAALRDGARIPAAVIADYRLRDNLTGVDAIRAVHEQCGREVPALLLTGDTEPSRMQEASSAGFPLLHKPVPAQKLGLFLERHLFAAPGK